MDITLSHRSALEALRTARTRGGKDGVSVAQTNATNPTLDIGARWTSKIVTELKATIGLPQGQPLDVMVRDASRRLRNRGVTCRVWGAKMQGLLFVELDKGITVPCPEILLLQMAETLPLAEVIALGHELCGKYSIANTASSSPAKTGIPAVTSTERIYQVLKDCRGMRGTAAVRDALRYIRDNSLSPMETCLSTLAQLPVEQYGYQLGDVILNESVTPDKGLSNYVLASSRVPDLLFAGTPVGINYDGGAHLDLDGIVTAARALAKNPHNTKQAAALDGALDKARRSVAKDKQRDRDLLAMGYAVLPVTRFDIQSIKDLDRVMGQVMLLIERTTERDLHHQKEALSDTTLQGGREALLRSLCKG